MHAQALCSGSHDNLKSFVDNFWHICVQLGSAAVTSTFVQTFPIHPSLCCVRSKLLLLHFFLH